MRFIYSTLILSLTLFVPVSCSKNREQQPINPAKKYASNISKVRNWHHRVYFYNHVNNPPSYDSFINDTIFAFKMLNDSTIYYQTPLKKMDDSVCYFESIYNRPYEFSLTYNFITDQVTFTQGSNAGGGGGGHTFISF